MDEITKVIRKLDKLAVKGIFVDPKLNRLLTPFFIGRKEKEGFINKCLTRLKTRRMLLRIQWYVEIADDMRKIKQSRPALNLIFLMALAESIAKQKMVKNSNDSLAAIKEFFKHISEGDKKILQRKFKRALLSPKTPMLRFSSIVRILYDVRNRAVHGDDFWSFSLLQQEQKESYEQEKYTDYGMLTTGSLGKRGKKRRVSLEIALTYEDLRGIFIRTAITNIQSLL